MLGEMRGANGNSDETRDSKAYYRSPYLGREVFVHTGSGSGNAEGMK